MFTLGGAVAIGAACVSYGILVEPRWYRRRAYRLEILSAGTTPLSVLHLSDLHFRPHDTSKARFLASLGQPDVVALTGDIIGDPGSVESAVQSLRPVRGRLASYFVLGSNDYFAPKPLNYLRYFLGPKTRRGGTPNRTSDLIVQLERDGWVHLENRKTSIHQDGFRAEVVGMDDPHIGLAVVHSPDPAPELAALGYQLIVAGHTHGGQVRLPFIGALVTNSQIPTRLAMGMSRMGRTLLHVSPGLGTSKFAPFRFLCRPEATVLELVPSAAPGGADAQRPGTGAADPARARSKTRS